MMEETNTVDMRLKAPFTAVLAGPTGSGKTHYMMSLLKGRESVTTLPPVETIYCYGAWQEQFNDLIAEGVRLQEGLIGLEDLPNDGRPRWLIIDDLMEEVSGKDSVNNLFTKYSHHRNISVFFMVQNLFKKANRTITLNAHYMFLFKNPRDKQFIDHLARQAFPGKVQQVRQVYERVTTEPYSFLLLDMRQETDERCRLIENFAVPGKTMYAYALT